MLLLAAVAVLALALTRQRAAAAQQDEETRLLYELAAPTTTSSDELERLADLSRERLGAEAVAVVAAGQVLLGGDRDPAAVLRDAQAPPARTAVARADGGPLGEIVVLAYPPAGGRLQPRATRLLRAFAGRAAAAAQRREMEAGRRDAAVLKETDRLRKALLSGVSHDLRTPLAAIKASANALAAEEMPREERLQLTGSIVAESDRLDRMVRNLLALSRIEAGRLVANREPVPVEELVGSVLARLRPALRGRRLELDVPVDLPPVQADVVQIEQVIGNLVENVLAHTPMNAGLIVRASARGNRVTVRVADDGPGIDSGDRQRVFERFGRGHGAGPGSGLGLAVAKAYAEANGGGLVLADTDCGAAFDVWLEAAEV